MKKLISLGLICAFVLIPGTMLSFFKNGIRSIADNISKTNYTVLICGYDEAAYNTDSIILANFDSEVGAVSFLQIPRDTYFNFSTGQNKINQYIPDRMSKGASLSDAMLDFKEEISSSLGIKIDAYAGYTMRAVADIVDELGGIDVDLPTSLTGVDLDGNRVDLREGYNHLTGSGAVVFLRHRQSYLLGDLGRLDAQKIFISSFAKKIKEDLDLKRTLKILIGKKDGVVTDIGFVKILGFGIKNFGRIKKSTVLYSDLAGEHVMSDNGISYYCLNRYASKELLLHLPFYKISEFDPNEKFNNIKDADFTEIYKKEDVGYKIYKDAELRKIKFATN